MLKLPNPTDVIAKIEAVFTGIEQFNTTLAQAIVAVEAITGPGSAATQLEAVKTMFIALNTNIDAAKALVAAIEAPFALIVQAVSNLIAVVKSKTPDSAAAH